ncbi:hypothetical protein KFL_004500100 [Klebsormidium nitens]|uniref:Uncharacterized protein n=1 Tax=Klebsormidium nitens TaxID=105231 RepID=A0A1Y1ICM2_KLENI|nr:hypothetical protein KFL_004500100 [Klebsormidium nitens]|eukprot:GAQ88670.1 hypothetical protein KFL_004500100 [Klebsormidium nitens]
MLEAVLLRKCGPSGVWAGRQSCGESSSEISSSRAFSQSLKRVPNSFCREFRGIADRKNVCRQSGSKVRAENGPEDLHIPLPFKAEIPCDICLGSGWLICDFCRGEKVNIQVKKKLYRRCPSCRAAGVLMCPRCKVLRCVTFPEGSDGALPT